MEREVVEAVWQSALNTAIKFIEAKSSTWLRNGPSLGTARALCKLISNIPPPVTTDVSWIAPEPVLPEPTIVNNRTGNNHSKIEYKLRPLGPNEQRLIPKELDSLNDILDGSWSDKWKKAQGLEKVGQ